MGSLGFGVVHVAALGMDPRGLGTLNSWLQGAGQHTVFWDDRFLVSIGSRVFDSFGFALLRISKFRV